jgi:hypothetical protein
MSLAYLTIADLKSERADDGKYLRWVESVLAWYQSDPLSAATGDDDTVVVPTAGVGRWLKQNSRANVVQGLTSQILTSNTTVSAGTKNYCDTTSTAITITLPTSPPTGALVSVFALAGTNLINKITINPNGANINGVSGNREITGLNEFVDLEFVAGSGWVVKAQSNVNVLKTPTVSHTVASPVSLPNYTGIINYLGRQKNTVSYQNPTNGASGRAIRCVVSGIGSGENNTLSGGNGVAVSGLFTGALSVVDSWFSNSINNISAGVWVDFLTSSVRASSIQFSQSNARWSTERRRRMLIFGANTFNPTNINSTYTYGTTTGANNVALLSAFEDLVLLSTLPDISTDAEWTLLSNQYHRLLTVNSTKFYRHYIIMAPSPNFTSTSMDRLPVNQLEFFGDVVAI